MTASENPKLHDQHSVIESLSLLNKKDQKRLSDRRAGIEPRIAHLKTRGLGRSRMKTDLGDLISGYRSALSYNLSLLMKDLAANQMNLMPA